MSFIRLLFLGALALVLVVLAIANRAMVTLRLIPEDLSGMFGVDLSVTMPLFLVIFMAMALGLLVGFVWEWLREHKHRAEARSERAQKEKLEKELAKAKRQTSEKDEVLALVGDG
ncbi:LapA family protein [Jannaschia marina]|uniref:LapA family protein n=1 Tax=Jannaschia marina TaxID=2741674 RepID=UPI0015CAFCBD|nr:LapA family protein [Jannaschia marina]